MFAFRTMNFAQALRRTGAGYGVVGLHIAKPALFVMPALCTMISVAAAQETSGRFAMKDIEGGILRMDTRTGRISQCKKQEEEWACSSIADDSAGLEDRISELKKENDALRAKLEEAETLATAKEEADKKAREKAAKQAEDKSEAMPQDEELNRVMAFIEKFMRRFFDLANTMRNSLGQEV